jgi:hypothetical protein
MVGRARNCDGFEFSPAPADCSGASQAADPLTAAINNPARIFRPSPKILFAWVCPRMAASFYALATFRKVRMLWTCQK